MAKDLSDIIARSLVRHAALALLTGGVGNILGVVGDVIDLADMADASDALDASDAADASDTTNSVSHSSGNGEVHFGASEEVQTTQGPAIKDDHGNVTTIPQSGTDVPKPVSPNDVIKP